MLVDPGQRCLEIRPQGPDGLEIASPLEVHTGEHDEQGRAVDAAIVQAERDLAEPRHLAMPGLVQDLARLGIGLGREAGCLPGGKEAEHAPGNRRVEPEQLHGGDDAVAAERGAEPGNPRVGIGPLRGLGHQHGEVGNRAAEDLVEDLARGGERGGARRGGSQRPPGVAQTDEEALGPGGRVRPAVADDGQEHRGAAARLEPLLEGSVVGC